MTLREKLADWLTSGNYQLRQDVRELNYRNMVDAWKLAGDYETALVEIEAQETPGANATVKRMAKIARDTLTHINN